MLVLHALFIEIGFSGFGVSSQEGESLGLLVRWSLPLIFVFAGIVATRSSVGSIGQKKMTRVDAFVYEQAGMLSADQQCELLMRTKGYL